MVSQFVLLFLRLTEVSEIESVWSSPLCVASTMFYLVGDEFVKFRNLKQLKYPIRIAMCPSQSCSLGFFVSLAHGALMDVTE